ncbi:rhomboid family intramembrane serine protease [Phycicoccus sp. CSK15P-2]|uniref:rhomboid family intramembrane serine protease n=1 Tax=Phycicoccus sp. CSK15P-2 TaxID=2807627 RepID=UPI00194E51BF|nr:rhomboid family intramembrane serine protease [Phycicoccus sp. CSK15P-2]MBM6403445.1 rhomboid family intramembrane serine protease [Phycicoccus sp. CSK15P-2]MBM6405921.1 rhomboid family intramembrane serine protease [Phycicoccus sp. CSK15P-2]
MTDPSSLPPAEEQVPVCPRHPDRESYVRCQRCGRPTCPECQRPAAVGIQCVDCVKEGARSMRQGRTVFGGAATDGRPLVTTWVIGICAVVYVLQQVVPGLSGRIAMVPAYGDTEPWRFLSSGFAHGSVLHILFNMYALWIMGQYLEPLLGRARFIALYLLSAFGGSVVLLLLAFPPSPAQLAVGDGGSWYQGAVGASGAVFGLFGAFLVLQRRLGRSAAGMYVVIGANAVLGFVVPNIAWQAHLGGLVTGAAAAAAIAYLGRSRGPMQPPDRRVHWAALGGLGLVLLALAVAKYALA